MENKVRYYAHVKGEVYPLYSILDLQAIVPVKLIVEETQVPMGYSGVYMETKNVVYVEYKKGKKCGVCYSREEFTDNEILADFYLHHMDKYFYDTRIYKNYK